MKLSSLGKYAAWIHVAAIVCASPCIAAQNNSAPGHYLQSCVGCHIRITGGEGELLYKRKGRLVNTYEELMKRVRHCSAGTGADWNAEKIEQTVRYLNARFYRFPPPADTNGNRDDRRDDRRAGNSPPD